LQTTVQRDIEDLKKIQALTASSDTVARQEIANELDKLTSENTTANEKITSLRTTLAAVSNPPSQPPANDVGAAITAGNSSVPKSPGTQPVKPNTLSPAAGSGPPSPAINLTPSTSSIAATSAPQTGNNLNLDLNNRIQEAVRARIQQRDPSKQAETPSTSTNSTSLANTSSAGDLVNVGFSLAGFNGDNNGANATDSVAVTASAYAFYAFAKNVDPLNPGFYNRNSDWRKLSFTLGYDNEKLANGTTQKAPIFGLKYLFIDERDPSKKRHEEDFKTIAFNLQRASVAFGNLELKVSFSFARNSLVKKSLLIPQFRIFLSERLKTASASASETARLQRLQDKLDDGELFLLNSDGLPPDKGEPGAWSAEELEFYSDVFSPVYLGNDYRVKLKDALGQKVLDDLDAFISELLTDTKAFEDLSDATREALERIRRAPQFSFNFLTKQRSENADEYHAETIFDYGVANRVNLTLNAAFLYSDSKVVGGDKRGGKFAGQFRFQLTPDKLVGRNPFYLFLSGNAEMLSGLKPLYKAQAKINIPVLNGVDFPFALTYANRNELGGEKNKTRLQFGFAVDTARILQALTPK
jgi:hypothetical protein